VAVVRQLGGLLRRVGFDLGEVIDVGIDAAADGVGGHRAMDPQMWINDKLGH
jgi:hypothetical protein